MKKIWIVDVGMFIKLEQQQNIDHFLNKNLNRKVIEVTIETYLKIAEDVFWEKWQKELHKLLYNVEKK